MGQGGKGTRQRAPVAALASVEQAFNRADESAAGLLPGVGEDVERSSPSVPECSAASAPFGKIGAAAGGVPGELGPSWAEVPLRELRDHLQMFSVGGGGWLFSASQG